MQLTAGSHLEQYTLDRQIGEGGMGTVWSALDTRTGTNVALKLLRGSDSLDVSRMRLLREAHTTRRLAHPAIVPVIDILSYDASPVLVMELLSGETLRALLTREQCVSLPRASQLLFPIAEALREAHAAGIVHRDLKPENIFIEQTREARPARPDCWTSAWREPSNRDPVTNKRRSRPSVA
jgi:serine/threonine protein kinase